MRQDGVKLGGHKRLEDTEGMAPVAMACTESYKDKALLSPDNPGDCIAAIPCPVP